MENPNYASLSHFIFIFTFLLGKKLRCTAPIFLLFSFFFSPSSCLLSFLSLLSSPSFPFGCMGTARSYDDGEEKREGKKRGEEKGGTDHLKRKKEEEEEEEAPRKTEEKGATTFGDRATDRDEDSKVHLTKYFFYF